MNEDAEQPRETPRARRWRLGRRKSSGPPSHAERAWIHPSELPNFDSIPVYDATASRRSHSTFVAIIALTVLAFGSVTLALKSSTPAATSSLPGRIGGLSDLPDYARNAALSTVQLVVSSGGHIESTSAMVIAPGDLAVTTDLIPTGASITGSSQLHHRFSVTFVSYDHALDFSIVKLGVVLPVAATGDLPASTTVLALASSFQPKTLRPRFAFAVTTLGDPVVERSQGTVSYKSTSSAPNLHGFADTLAVDQNGRVVAVLSARGRWFSAQYLTKVARVVTLNGGCHGLLGIKGYSAQGGGVLVVKVNPGPAQHRLHVGDVLISINGIYMDSVDSLLAYLYATPTRTGAMIHLLRHGTAQNVGVVLGCQP